MAVCVAAGVHALQTVYQALSSAVLLCIVTLTALISSLPCLLYKAYCTIKYKRMLSDKQIPIQPSDAIWYHDTCDNRCIVHALAFVNGPVTVEELRTRFQDKAIDRADGNGFYKLRCREYLENGLLTWEKMTDFDIRHHVKRFSGQLSHIDDVQEYVSSVINQPFPEDQPPWSITLLSLANDSSVILFRFKHTIADGLALVQLFLQTVVDESTPSMPVERVQPHSVSVPKHSTSGQYGWLWKAFLHIPENTDTLFKSPDMNFYHGNRKLTGQVKVAWSRPVPLSTIKAIKNRHCATVNDVLVTAACEGLSRYSVAHGAVSSQHDVTCFIPASVRKPSSVLTLENQIGLIPVQVSISNNLDVFQRLHRTKCVFDEMKQMRQPQMNILVQNALTWMLPSWIADIVFDSISRRGTAVISNVPGPAEKITIFGHSVDKLTFFVPSRADIGIGISMISYANEIVFGVRADASVCDDPRWLCELMVDSIHSMTGSSS